MDTQSLAAASYPPHGLPGLPHVVCLRGAWYPSSLEIVPLRVVLQGQDTIRGWVLHFGTRFVFPEYLKKRRMYTPVISRISWGSSALAMLYVIFLGCRCRRSWGIPCKAVFHCLKCHRPSATTGRGVASTLTREELERGMCREGCVPAVVLEVPLGQGAL